MTNLNYEDLNFNQYKKLLKYAKKHYKFLNSEEHTNGDNGIFWRHDVDCSPHRALKLALIERDYEIHSTYFIRLDAEFYNLFEKDILLIFFKIIELGHEIGLHFWANPFNSFEETVSNLEKEKQILEIAFSKTIESFSFHNPTPEILNLFIEDNYANMRNIYSNQQRNIHYCSDSNGYYRYDSIEHFLKKKHKKLQVLTHPVWWQDSVMKPFEKVERSGKSRYRNQINKYNNLMIQNGRKNIK